jgi:LmbE family N-acetylglucosaminyl deacetylase
MKIIKLLIRSLLVFALLILILLLSVFFFAKSKLTENESPISMYEAFPLSQNTNVIMCLFAHPDDEISVAGTVYKLSQNPNNQIIGIYLTKGEAGGTGGLVSQEKLGEERTKELQNLSKILGYKHLEIFGFPDSGLPKVDSAEVKARILESIYKYRPNIIISFDDKVGLYGHPDHLLTGKWAKSICETYQAVDSFPVQQLYCPTLSKGMIHIALSIAETFKRNYPKEPEKGLPSPSFAVDISDVGVYKLQAIQAHRTQKRTFDDVFPLHDQISPHIFFRLFDREYFTIQVQKK